MRTQWMVVGSVAVLLGLGACSSSVAETGVDTTADSKVEDVPGKDVKQVTLTEHAATRLGIKTVTLGGTPAGVAAGAPGPSAMPGTVVPYSAVLYDADGGTWVYTVPRQFTYVREKVTVVVVRGAKGDEAVLSQAPPTGTTIVTTGVVELYGTELGIGEVTE
jgi:hypothetical protein